MVRVARLIDAAVLRLDPLQSSAADHIKESYADILVDQSTTLRCFGRSRAVANAQLTKASTILQQIKAPSPMLSLRVAVLLSRMRNAMVTDASCWVPAQRRLETLTDLSNRAHVAGSLELNVDTAYGLMEYGAHVGNDELVRESTRYALAIIKHDTNPRSLADTTITVAEMLLYTRYWRDVPILLRSVDQEALRHTRQDMLKHIEARYYLRSGMHSVASSLAAASSQSEAGPFYRAQMYVVAAAAADALERPRDAMNFIEHAISMLEECGSALALRDAYGIAAKVTGNARFLKEGGGSSARALTT